MRPSRVVEPSRLPKSKLQCDVSGEQILGGVVEALEHFVFEADLLPCGSIKASVFDGGILESRVSIREYLFHIAKAGLCSKECFVIALVYAERLLQKQENFVISRNNVHRLMLVSIMVASKVLDDFYCRNMFYSKAGGITMDQINDLELNLCFMLDFALQVQPSEFALYRDSLRREVIHPLDSIPPSNNSTSSIPSNFELGQLWMVSIPQEPRAKEFIGSSSLASVRSTYLDASQYHQGKSKTHHPVVLQSHFSNCYDHFESDRQFDSKYNPWSTYSSDSSIHQGFQPRSCSTVMNTQQQCSNTFNESQMTQPQNTAFAAKYTAAIQQRYAVSAPVNYELLAQICRPQIEDPIARFDHDFCPQVAIGWLS